MTSAHEEDVVIAFRQAVEEELRKLQSGGATPSEDIFAGDVPTEESLRRLARRCDKLEHELALLRTIVLRLMSEPVDG